MPIKKPLCDRSDVVLVQFFTVRIKGGGKIRKLASFFLVLFTSLHTSLFSVQRDSNAMAAVEGYFGIAPFPSPQ